MHIVNIYNVMVTHCLLVQMRVVSIQAVCHVPTRFYLYNSNLMKKWRCRGSNPGPFTCKANALPLSYIPYDKLNGRLFPIENVRRPGIEPGAQEWESCMLPLHQRRFVVMKCFVLLVQALYTMKLNRMVRPQKCGTLHDFACHPCAGAMLIFSVSFQF